MLRRRIAGLCFLLLLTSFIFSGCAGKQSPGKPDGESLTVSDALTEGIKIPKYPERVAVLFSSFADIWETAGGEIAVTVGESVERGFASEDVVLVDGGAGKMIDNERLFAAEPDLVICSADIAAQSDTAALCRAAGIPALALRVESFEDYLRVLDLFTDLTGEKARYETYGTALAERIESLKKDHSDSAEPKKILFVRAGSGARYTKAKRAQDHFAAQMLAELGAENIADAAPVLLDGLSFEEILRQDPELIFIATMGDEAAAKQYMNGLLQDPAWQALSAVRNGKVCYLPKDLFQYKPNARWDEAYAYLAELLK